MGNNDVLSQPAEQPSAHANSDILGWLVVILSDLLFLVTYLLYTLQGNTHTEGNYDDWKKKKCESEYKDSVSG